VHGRQSDKPIIMTEYGADTISGMHGIFPSPWSEEYQVALLDMSHQVFDRIDAVVGEQSGTSRSSRWRPGSCARMARTARGSSPRARTKVAAAKLRRRWRP
jgi:beta-glucuronidase